MSTNDLWFVGEYHSELLVVPQSRMIACRDQLQILTDVFSAASWDEVTTRWTVDDIESALGRLLDLAWWRNDPEPDDDRPMGILPPLELVLDGSLQEDRLYAADCLDDSDELRRLLPQDVMDLAVFPAISPMTEYEPCHWDRTSLPAIHAAAHANGAQIFEDQAPFSEVESLYFSL